MTVETAWFESHGSVNKVSLHNAQGSLLHELVNLEAHLPPRCSKRYVILLHPCCAESCQASGQRTGATTQDAYGPERFAVALLR